MILRSAPHHGMRFGIVLVISILVSLVTTGLSLPGVPIAAAAGPSAGPEFQCSGIRFFESAGVGKHFIVGDQHLGGTFTYIEDPKDKNFVVVRDPVTGVVVAGFNHPFLNGDAATIEFNRTIKIVAILWFDNDPDTSRGETGWSVNGIPGPLTGHNNPQWTLENITTREVRINSGLDSGGVDFCFEDVPVTAQGCTPGYWKVKQHWDSWVPTGYSTTQRLDSVFTNVPNTLKSKTLVQALAFQGGSGVQGGAQIVLRASVAALLNSSHPHVMNYPYSRTTLIAAVNTALSSNNRATMLTLATTLDNDNNRGCPLN